MSSGKEELDKGGLKEEEEEEFTVVETVSIKDLSADQLSSLGTLANKVLKFFDDEKKEAEDQKNKSAHPVHVKARSKDVYSQRVEVSDEQVNWDVGLKDYDPPDFTTEAVFKQDRSKTVGGWADPVDFFQDSAFANRLTFEPKMAPASDGRPRNPRGRTGLRGRGRLGKWGANQAADPIVIRKNPTTLQPEVILIKRADSHLWAIPGGMVDDGENASLTLRREFEEEAAKLESQDDRDLVNSIFGDGPHQHVIYHGYIDDPRNTDNSWMESTVHAFVCNEKQAKLLRFEAAKGETLDVQWVPFSKLSPTDLYASHLSLLNMAIKKCSPSLYQQK